MIHRWLNILEFGDEFQSKLKNKTRRNFLKQFKSFGIFVSYFLWILIFNFFNPHLRLFLCIDHTAGQKNLAKYLNITRRKKGWPVASHQHLINEHHSHLLYVYSVILYIWWDERWHKLNIWLPVYSGKCEYLK